MVADDLLREVIAARARERRQAGQSCVDIALWLDRIGYHLDREDLAAVIAQHAQHHDARQRNDPPATDLSRRSTP